MPNYTWELRSTAQAILHAEHPFFALVVNIWGWNGWAGAGLYTIQIRIPHIRRLLGKNILRRLLFFWWVFLTRAPRNEILGGITQEKMIFLRLSML